MDLLINQVNSFAATVVIGVAAGFCYDYYRVVRGTLRLRKVGTLVGDVLFWLLTTALVFLMLLLGNWGEMRLYVLIGLALGSLVYFWLFSGSVRRILQLKFFLLKKTWDLLVRVLLLFRTAILFPFRLLLLVFSYPLHFLGGLLQKANRKATVVLENLVGRRVKRVTSTIKRKLAQLVFWKRKKED